MTLREYLQQNPAATDAEIAAYSATFTLEFIETWITERTLVGKFGLPLAQAAGLVYALYQLGTPAGNPDATDAERFTYARLYDRLVGDGLDLGTKGSHDTLDGLALLMPEAAPLFATLKAASSRKVYPLGQAYTEAEVAAERELAHKTGLAVAKIVAIQTEANARTFALEAWVRNGCVGDAPEVLE